jgi:hypothetical protein
LQNYNSNKPRRNVSGAGAVESNQFYGGNGYVRHEASFDEHRLNNNNKQNNVKNIIILNLKF